MKRILDVCCGSKMFYFNKNNPLVHFNDIRKLEEPLCDGRMLKIHPDTQGFDECMRVLKPYGTLVFKWNETDIKQKELFEVLDTIPIFGDKGRGNKTYWFVFMKESEYKCQKKNS